MTYEQRLKAYLEAYAKLPPEQQAIHSSILLKRVAARLLALDMELPEFDEVAPEPANLEEIPADDQAAIDSAFDQLMEGFDL